MPSSHEPLWLTAGEIIELNRLLVVSTGEPHGILSMNMLEAAAASPRNKYLYENASLLPLAVKLIFSLGTAHAFSQGNKRTAFFAAVLFLENNGGIFAAPDIEDIGAWVVQLIEHKLTEEQLITLLSPYVVSPH